jgi:odorant receptor
LKLFDLVTKLDEIYKLVVFTDFLFGSMLLCFLGFQLVVIEGFIERIVPTLFSIAIIIQLLIYASGGQVIVDRSDEIARDFYDVDRDLLMLIARPLRSPMIRSLYFKADLPMFLTVMQSAGSLIAMLKSFLK